MMQLDPLAEPRGPGEALRVRSSSMSSDFSRPGAKSGVFLPPPVHPEPQYIAASAACRILMADEDLDELESPNDTGGVSITPSSLALLNGFLDNLLFNILMTAKSTKLIAMRPALAEVLRPRLAQEVVSAADEELSEYMGGGDEEELSEFHGGSESIGQFDLERSWKLARLRCMVYTRLGDMEEDDEEDHLEEYGLNKDGSGWGRFSSNFGHVTPAAAIFLTSILEYIGERALIISGDAARNRMLSRKAGISRGGESEVELGKGNELVVEDIDMEKLALNSTLGRLWRSWRRLIRIPTLTRSLSRESWIRRGNLPVRARSRQSSIGTVGPFEEPQMREMTQEDPVAEMVELEDPASIPLPASDSEMDEPESEHSDPESGIVGSREKHGQKPRQEDEKVVDSVEHESVQPPSVRNSQRRDSMDPEVDTEGDNTLTPNSMSPSVSIGIDVDTGTPKGAEKPQAALPEPVHEAQQTKDDEDCDNSAASVSSDYAAEESLERDAEKGVHHDPGTDEAPLSPKSSDIDRDDSRTRSTLPGKDLEPNTSNSTDGDLAKLAEPSSGGITQDVIVETSFVSRFDQPNSQQSQLTPLKELAKGPGDISNQEPSTIHHSGPSLPVAMPVPPPVSGEVGGPPTSRTPTRNIAKTTNSGSVTPRYPPPIPTASPGAERAAVQRVTPPSLSRRDSGASRTRRSESISSSRDKRPITSGSNASPVSSKLKGLVGWQTSESDSRHPFVRSSAEARDGPSRAEDVFQDPSSLDDLIKSDETIHFTLTPRNMREMEDPDSPRWVAARSDATDMVDLKNTATPEEAEKPPETPEIPGRMQKGHHIKSQETASPLKPRFTELPPTQASSHYPKKRLVQLQARDARPERNSMRDFAEFLRSTGPELITQVSGHTPPPQTGFGAINPPSTAQGSGAAGSAASRTPVISSPMSPVLKEGSTAKRIGPRFEARPAAATRDDHTSELIKFFRDGPPGDNAQRVARVGPQLRTTVSPDECPTAGPARIDKDAVTQSSTASTYEDSAVTNSSFNSRTALLDSANRSSNRADGHISSAMPHAGPSAYPQRNDSMPIRKRRVVRDPYAIDSDSEGELDGVLESPYSKPPPEQESLVDFLRNVPPPPDVRPTPQLFSVNESPTGSSSKLHSRSNLSMKSRLMRTASTDKSPASKLSKSSLRSRKSYANGTSGAPPSVPVLPMPSISHISWSSPSQGPRSTDTGHQSSGGKGTTPRGSSIERRNDYPHIETGTRGLADIFRNTNPPGAHSESTPVEKERRGSNQLAKAMRKMKNNV